jgi:hypothetical protein
VKTAPVAAQEKPAMTQEKKSDNKPVPSEENSSVIWFAMPLAAGLFLWWAYDKRQGKTWYLWVKITDKRITVSRLIVGVVACHLLVWYFWPEWYKLLRDNPVFWLDHAMVLVVFLFFRKETRTRTGVVKELTGIGTLLLLILVAGNIHQVWQWQKPTGNHPIFATAPIAPAIGVKIKRVTAPVGEPSEAVDVIGKPNDFFLTGKVLVWADDRKPVEDGPGVNHNYGTVKSFKFQSREDKPVTVTFLFK